MKYDKGKEIDDDQPSSLEMKDLGISAGLTLDDSLEEEVDLTPSTPCGDCCFYGVLPLFKRSTLRVNDIRKALQILSTGVLERTVYAAWGAQLAARSNSLEPVLRKVGLSHLLLAFLLALLNGLLHTVPLFLLPAVLEFLLRSPPEFEYWEGWIYGGLVLFAMVLSSYLDSHAYLFLVKARLQIRVGLQVLLFGKSLEAVSPNTENQKQIMEELMMCIERVSEQYPALVIGWVLPFQLIIIMVLLWKQIGAFSLIPLGMLIIHFVIVLLSSKLMKKPVTLQTITKQRVSKTIGIFEGIRNIKFNVWEESFLKTMFNIRTTELALIKNYLLGIGFLEILASNFHIISIVITLVLFSLWNIASSTTFYSAFLLILHFQSCHSLIAQYLSCYYQYKYAMKQLTQYFLRPNAQKHPKTEENIGDKTPMKNPTKKSEQNMLVLHNGFIYYWEDDAPFLRNLYLKVPDRSLVMLTGPSRSGKTSIAKAFLREVNAQNVTVNGSVAFIEGGKKGAFIRNTSIFHNITFGKAFDQKLYHNVIACSGLKNVISLLPATDNTILNDQEISYYLRQQIGIARALYAQKDIYIFDETLKDLPRPLAKFIFRFAIQKFLVSKAIFFITNEKRYLSVADQIYTINQGQVHISPLQTEKWDLFNLSALDDDKIIENLDSWQKNEVESLKMDYPELSDMFRLKGVKKSEVHPDPPGTTLRHLIRKGGIYPWVSFFFLVLSTGSFIFSAWWLKYWAEHIIDKLALGIFALTLSLNLIFLFIFLFVFMVNITKIAQSAHDESLEKAVRTWMNKIEQFPLEKLLSIFSNDITAMDLKFFGTAMKFGIVSCQLLGIFVAVSVGTPFSLICVPLVVFIFLYIYKNYQIAKDSLETHEAATYQHLLKYIQETLEGRIHVRSLNKGYFYNEFKKVLDSYTLASFMNHYLFCWGAVRMSGLWLVYYMTTLLTVILTKDYEYYLYSTQNMLFSITLVSHGFFVFKSFWSIQGNFNRELKVVSRVTSLEKLPIEDIFQNRVFKHKWPTKGNLEIIKYNWKSTTHMTLLSDINFKAKHNDRVVIIEKQKLVADAFIYALFRMILPESGKIIINKVDVSDVSLTLLRTQISIMPRDCPLFEGTVYSNIDPKETLPKEKITKRFKKFEVEKFMDVREDIEDLVSDKGLNFSYPQRQLIHLVRISLLKPKILLIEFPLLHSRTKEITQIIQKNFSNTTIIVLSENYKSLPLKYNQVLQLNGGFGDLSNNDNVFQELLKVH